MTPTLTKPESPERQKAPPVRYHMCPDIVIAREFIANHGETSTPDLMRVIGFHRVIAKRYKVKTGSFDLGVSCAANKMAQAEQTFIFHRTDMCPSKWVLRSWRTRPDRP